MSIDNTYAIKLINTFKLYLLLIYFYIYEFQDVSSHCRLEITAFTIINIPKMNMNFYFETISESYGLSFG